MSLGVPRAAVLQGTVSLYRYLSEFTNIASIGSHWMWQDNMIGVAKFVNACLHKMSGGKHDESVGCKLLRSAVVRYVNACLHNISRCKAR